MNTQTVGILGGMGPAAGVDFVRLFVQACTDHMKAAGQPVVDQAYPEHWLAQLPIPDRSTALLAPDTALGGCRTWSAESENRPQRAQFLPDLQPHSPAMGQKAGGKWAAAVDLQLAISKSDSLLDPFPMMCTALDKLQAVGAQAVAVACNTAHAWHARLQGAYPQMQLLHIARVVAHSLQQQGHGACMLLATQGTYRIGLYDEALAACGITVHLPQEAEREQLMHGIYQGVKAGQLDVARSDFAQVAAAMRARHGDAPLVMGCTEIPLALPGAPEVAGLTLVDPAWELARALAQVAYTPSI